MHCLWCLSKKFFLVSTLLLVSMSWYPQVEAGSLRLTWEDTSDNEDGFKIERLVAGLVDATLTVGSNANSYTDSGLVNGIIYCYRLSAFNAAGDSSPSNQPCIAAQDITPANLAMSTTTAVVGSTFTFTWSAITAPTTTDWIGVYVPGASDTNFLDWMYVSCSKTPTSAHASGSCSYALPATFPVGNYELRLFANDGYTRIGSSSFTVAITPPTLTVSPTTAKPGSTLTATWSGITAPAPKDWIGLYAPGAVDTAFINWIYVSCSTTAGSARASGSCSYSLPATLSAGNYELRLFANDGFTRVVSTSSFTVAITPPTLTASPTTAKPGSTVTATWSGITAPAPKDWIGLYAPGATNANFVNWIYVNCTMTATTARASGSCAYPLPAKLALGKYELRLFADNGFTRLATSSAVTVSRSINTTQTTLLTNVTSTSTNPSNIPSSTPVPSTWVDYDVTLKLQSVNRNSVGVMFRYQDDKNHYRFLWNRNSKFRRVEKVQDGVVTVLANDATAYITGQTYRLQVIAQGPALKVMIDGSQIFSVTDTSFADGTIGLYSSDNAGTVFDDVMVKDLATGTILLADDFNDGNFIGWTVLDQSTTTASSWSAAGGSLVQSSNINGTLAIYTLRNWTDYVLTLKMQSQDRDSIGVMFRYQDNDNYYRFSWNRRNNFRRLEKRQNGVFTVLAEDIKTYVTGRTYHVEMTANGTALHVAIDGQSVFSAIDSSFSKGTVALYSNTNEGSMFDDILVQDLATGAVLLQNDFNNKIFNGWTIVDDKAAARRPSAWSAQTGALVQSNNIGSNSSGNLGTYALY